MRLEAKRAERRSDDGVTPGLSMSPATVSERQSLGGRFPDMTSSGASPRVG